MTSGKAVGPDRSDELSCRSVRGRRGRETPNPQPLFPVNGLSALRQIN